MAIFYKKIGIISLTTVAMWSTTSSIALAEIDWGNVIASYINPNGESINPATESNMCADRYTDCNSDGSITFRAYTTFSSNTGSSSSYRRAEMRVFADDAVINDDGSYNGSSLANNFVLDSASSDNRDEAGGVNAVVTSTLSIDRLPTTGLDDTSDSDFDYGSCSEDFQADYDQAVIFSQFHGGDEPMRAYAVGTGSDTFAIWIIHEPNGEDDIKCPMDLDRDLSLGEQFSFVAQITGDDLSVSVSTSSGGQLGSMSIDISDSGYEDDDIYLYGKWGAYNSNNQGDSGDHAAVTYYSQNYSYGN